MVSNKSFAKKVVASFFNRGSEANIAGEIFSDHYRKTDDNNQTTFVGRRKKVAVDANGLPVYEKIKDDVQFGGKGYYSFSNTQKPEFPAKPNHDWGFNLWEVRVIARVQSIGAYTGFFSNGYNIPGNLHGVWFGLVNDSPALFFSSSGINLLTGITGVTAPENDWFEIIYEKISSTQLKITIDNTSVIVTPINLSTYEFGDPSYPIWLTGDFSNNYGGIDLALIECSVDGEMKFATYFEEYQQNILYDVVNDSSTTIPNYLLANWKSDAPDTIAYSHLNQKGYNGYFKPPATGDAYTFPTILNNRSNYAFVAEFVAGDSNPTYGAVIFSMGTGSTITSMGYFSAPQSIKIATNGSTLYTVPVTVPTNQVICIAVNVYASFVYDISINGAPMITMTSVDVLNADLSKLVIGTNVQQESFYFEPTLPTKKVEIYSDPFSQTDLETISQVGLKEDPLNSPNLFFSKYYNSTDVAIPASLSNPNQDAVGRPLEYKGTLAPRAQVVESGKIILNGIDQKFQVAYQPTNIKINGVDVTGDWTITDIGGGNWTFEPSVATDVYNMVINDTYIYPCGELNGIIAYDKSGNSSHATVINAVLPTIRGTQDVYHENFYNGYWLYKDASDNEIQLPVDAGTTVTIDSVDFTKVGFIEGYATTGKYNGASPIKFPDIPEIPIDLRGVTLSPDILQKTSSPYRTSLEQKGLIISSESIPEIHLTREGYNKHGYLDPYIGSELGWALGFTKRISSFDGVVATLRKLSDGSTRDIYFTGDKINWNDPSLVSWIGSSSVEVLQIYNQFPASNRLFNSIGGSDGISPIIAESGTLVKLTGIDKVAFQTNGTNQFLSTIISPSISQQNLYMVVVGENRGDTNKPWAHTLSKSSDANPYQTAFFSTAALAYYRNISQDLFIAATGGETCVNNPSIVGYQELGTSRNVSQNGVVLGTQGTTANFVTGIDRFMIGRLRDLNPFYSYNKVSESIGFLEPKITDRLNIENLINVKYEF